MTPGPRKAAPKGSAKKAPSNAKASSSKTAKPAPSSGSAGRAGPTKKPAAQPNKPAAQPAKKQPSKSAKKTAKKPGRPAPDGGKPGKKPLRPLPPGKGGHRPVKPEKPEIPVEGGKDKIPGLDPGKGFGLGKGGALNDWAVILGKKPPEPRLVRASAAPWRARMGVPAGGYTAKLPDLRVPMPTPSSAGALLRVASRRVDPQSVLHMGVGALEASAREMERLARRGGPGSAALARQGELARAVAGMAATMKPPRIPDLGPRGFVKADRRLLGLAAAYGRAKIARARDLIRKEGARSIARRFSRKPAGGAQDGIHGGPAGMRGKGRVKGPGR